MPKGRRRGQETIEGGVIESLEPIESRSARKEFRRLQKPDESPEVDFENRLWLLIHSLRPESISIGKDPTIQLKDGSFRPDAIGIFEHSILIVEGKYTDARSFITDWVSKYRSVRRQLHEILEK